MVTTPRTLAVKAKPALSLLRSPAAKSEHHAQLGDLDESSPLADVPRRIAMKLFVSPKTFPGESRNPERVPAPDGMTANPTHRPIPSGRRCLLPAPIHETSKTG